MRRIPIFRCSIADLANEWIVSLCVILSIAAILLPLEVLYGLKFGVITSLENRLRNDPRSREIRPASSGLYTREWLQKWTRDPRVLFLVGMPRTISANVEVSGKGGKTDADITPTGLNDPYLNAARVPVPKENECLISEKLAAMTGSRIGEVLTITVRKKGGGPNFGATKNQKVIGILPDALCDHSAIWTTLEVAESVEDYLDGFAVDKFGWKGALPIAQPAYDGVIVTQNIRKENEPETSPSLSKEDVKLQIMNCLGGTGLTTIVEDNPELRSRLGLTSCASKDWVYLSNINSMIELDGIERLRQKLIPFGLVVIPWILPQKAVVISGKNNISVNIMPWSNEARQYGLAPNAEPKNDPRGEAHHLLCSRENSASGEVLLKWKGLNGDIEIKSDLIKTEGVLRDEIWMESNMAGLIKRSGIRPIILKKDGFVYARRGYASFRMSSRTLDGVIELKKSLGKNGIEVLTESQRIEDIRFLDRQLSLIIMIFTIIIGAGAITSLWAIAYSSAERKKRYLAFLQIMGATKWQSASFPLYQAIILTSSGAAVGWLGGTAFSLLVNNAFSSMVREGESVCTLPLTTMLIGFFILIIISLVCYLIMIPRFIGMPLGEAAREP